MSCDHNKGKVRTENACRVVTSNVRREMVSRFPNISMIAGHQITFLTILSVLVARSLFKSVKLFLFLSTLCLLV